MGIKEERMRKMKKTKKWLCLVMAAVLMLGSLFTGEAKASAAMVDEAMDFKIGDTLEGGFTEDFQRIYYRFSLDSKQRILIKGMSPEDVCRSMDDNIKIYNVNGEELMIVSGYSNKTAALYWTYNAATDMYSLKLPVTLNKGTYYLGIYRKKQGSEYAFTTEYAPSTKYPSMQLSINLKKGNTLQLGAVISPTSAQKKLKWSSSKKSIASVSSKGKISAKKKGTAYITAKCNGTKIKVKVVVK